MNYKKTEKLEKPRNFPGETGFLGLLLLKTTG